MKVEEGVKHTHGEVGGGGGGLEGDRKSNRRATAVRSSRCILECK